MLFQRQVSSLKDCCYTWRWHRRDYYRRTTFFQTTIDDYKIDLKESAYPPVVSSMGSLHLGTRPAEGLLEESRVPSKLPQERSFPPLAGRRSRGLRPGLLAAC
jgi:hypothetical protein